MQPSESQLRAGLVKYSHRVWERGWVANHDGNLSLRLPRGRLMCTPTGETKADLTAEMMLVVDHAGKVLSGKLRPFSELNLHMVYYQAREDVGAVLHAHPVAATALGAAGVDLPHPFLPEAVVSLGPAIPTVPLALPGEEAARAIHPLVDDHDALLLTGNGALTCGVDLEQAFLRMELLEHLCSIALAALPVGGVKQLPPRFLEPLLAARTRAGLGPEARGRAPAAAPTSSAGRPAPELERLVRDEIARVLAQKGG